MSLTLMSLTLSLIIVLLIRYYTVLYGIYGIIRYLRYYTVLYGIIRYLRYYTVLYGMRLRTATIHWRIEVGVRVRVRLGLELGLGLGLGSSLLRASVKDFNYVLRLRLLKSTSTILNVCFNYAFRH